MDAQAARRALAKGSQDADGDDAGDRMTPLAWLSGPSLVVRCVLAVGSWRFRRAGERLDEPSDPGAWPAFTFIPKIRSDGPSAWRAALFPLAALLYGAMTVASALAHRRGRGGAWKGRLQGGSLGSDASL